MPQNKTIWYGAKDNNVRFAHEETSLKNEGFQNVRSFVMGDVTGLNLIDDTPQQQTSQSGSQQPA